MNFCVSTIFSIYQFGVIFDLFEFIYWYKHFQRLFGMYIEIVWLYFVIEIAYIDQVDYPNRA